MSLNTTSDDYLAESLTELKSAKDDAREYHKLESGVPKTLQFIIEDKKRDILVERKQDEKSGKPYSETTFVRVINLNSQVQEPKPLRTGSVRLLKKLNDQFNEGNFTLEITKFGEQFDTDYKVKSVK